MKLEKLIQYRKWKEECSRRELVAKKQLLAKESDKLKVLRGKKAEGQNDFLQWQQGNISPELLRLYANFIMSITAKCQVQRKEMDKVEAHVQEKRWELLKHSQEKKVIEKLKEKIEQAARKAQDKVEQQFLDEISRQFKSLGH